jgi:hypothetical protein
VLPAVYLAVRPRDLAVAMEHRSYVADAQRKWLKEEMPVVTGARRMVRSTPRRDSTTFRVALVWLASWHAR